MLAQRGAQAVLKMIVQDGVFHADPHPGNVFYLPGNRIAFIDFGMVGRLSQRRRDELLQLLLGLVEHQPQAVADVLLDWTGDGPGVNVAQLDRDFQNSLPSVCSLAFQSIGPFITRRKLPARRQFDVRGSRES